MSATADVPSEDATVGLVAVGERLDRLTAAVEAAPNSFPAVDLREASAPSVAVDRARQADEPCVVCEHRPPEVDAGAVAAALDDASLDAPLLIVDVGQGVPDVGPAYGVGVARDDDPAWLARRLNEFLAGYWRERDLRDERETVEASLDALSDVFYIFDLDGTMRRWNERFVSVTGYEDEAIAEMHPVEFVVDDDRRRIREAIDRVRREGRVVIRAHFETADGESLPYEFTGSLLRGEDGEPRGICGVGRDISDRLEREETLLAQRAELADLHRVHDVVRDVDRELVRAETREAIESAVCDRLVAGEPYEFAWIGRYDAATGATHPTVWAGDDDEGVGDLAGEDGVSEPTATALRTGEVTVAREVDADAGVECRAAARERGFASCAAVPLAHGETVYGVLHVYAADRDGFDDREVAVLEHLGETVGHAITGVQQRQALIADDVTELTFRLRDPDLFPHGVSEETGAAFELVDARRRSDDTDLQYYDVRGCDVDAVEEADAVREVRVIRRENGDDDGVRVEAVVDGPSVASAASTRDAVVRSLAVEGGTSTVVLEIPTSAGPSDLATSVRETVADVRLVSKRSLDRREDGREVAGSLGFDLDLTDRQRAAVETAWHAGYFDSPRRSTGAEVAEALAVSAPTFHEHLRSAERKLVGAYISVIGARRPDR